MDPPDGKRQASIFALEDVIDSMPDNVITNILDCLPLQDVVKTSILSRNWRYKWTMISKLVFDKNLIEYSTKGGKSFNGRIIISRILLKLKDVITKVVFYIPRNHNIFDAEDLNHWLLFLSTKGMKEFALINDDHITPLKLPTHIFSCLELNRLRLHNCYFPPTSNFHGFPNLLVLDFNNVGLENCEKLITCPLLEILKIDYPSYTSQWKLVEIAKLENLKTLAFSLSELAITSAYIFQLVHCLPKLQKLDLNLQNCEMLPENGAGNRISTALHGLKSISLRNLDFNSRVMVFFSFDLIQGSPNLQTLKIMAANGDRVSQPPLASCEVKGSIKGSVQQLRNVRLEGIKNSKIELCLIKSLLAYCSLLQNMVINYPYNKRVGPRPVAAVYDYMNFSEKLLMLPRASTVAKIKLMAITIAEINP